MQHFEHPKVGFKFNIHFSNDPNKSFEDIENDID